MRVLHVVEELASGVLSSLRLLTAEQSKLGAEVSVLFTRGPDTPTTAELDRGFGGVIQRIEVPVSRGMPAPLLLAKALRRQDPDQYDVIHAHSSWAGLVVRATAFNRARWPRIWYSPHAYGFLRTDTHPLIRRSALVMERQLSRVGSIAAVSESEAELARTAARAPRVFVLQNRVDIASLPCRTEHPLRP